MARRVGFRGWLAREKGIWRQAMSRGPAVLLLMLAALPVAAQNPSAVAPPKASVPTQRSGGRASATRQEAKELAIPESITLSSGESIPVADIIPRAGAAQKQLAQILSELSTLDTETVAISLNKLNSKIGVSRQGAHNAIRIARSPLQLTQPRIEWTRYRSDLEELNAAATKEAATLEGLRQQARSLSETWSNMATAAIAANLPDKIVRWIQDVEKMADSTRTTLGEKARRLIEIQDHLSETRKEIDDVIVQIDTADASMRDRLFVLDSPPLWSAGKTSTWSETAQQIREYYAAASSRSFQFLQSYRYLLLLYGVLSVAILVSIIQISRRDLTAEGTGIDAHYLACLEHPIAITALVTLVVFGAVFSKAPGDLLRFVRVVMVIPVVIICFSFVEQRMRPLIVAAAVLFVVDMLVMEFLGGTLLGRIAVLSFTTCLLAGLTALLRKQGLWRAFFAERRMVLMRMCCHIAALLLLVAVVANILGNMSLARLLTDGTIISVYWALAVYVFCAVLIALTAALTASDVGRRLRAVRVHTVLVNRKIAAYLTLLNWGLWFLTVLAAFQVSTKALDAAREILYYKSKIGAISLSLLDVVLFGLVLIVSSITARLIRFIVDEEILPRTTLETGVAQAGSRLTYIALLILGLILAFGAAGLELSKFTVLTGAFGVGLAFGLQNLLNNFVSGIIISLERPMKIGDMIEVPNLFGEVTAIGLRSSTIQTFEGASVMVPNSEFITKSFANWSLKERLRRTDLKVGVPHGTDPSQVLEVLTRVVIGHAQVLPSPLITFDQFGQSTLDFTVRFWSKMDDRLQIRSDLNLLISNEFAKNGIGIALPQRRVNLKPEGDASDLRLAQQETTKGPAT